MFSQRELDILKILARRRMTYASIAEELFTPNDRPIDPEIAIGNTVRRIIKKCDLNKLNWTLVKKKVTGKMTVWKLTY
jgi:hypothetical protein